MIQINDLTRRGAVNPHNEIQKSIITPVTPTAGWDSIYEDLRLYTEVEPSGDPYTVSEDGLELAYASTPNLTQTYFYKDYGADYFSGDYTIEWEHSISVVGLNTNQCGFIVASQVGAINTALGSGCLWHRGSRLQLYQQDMQVVAQLIWDTGGSSTRSNEYYQLKRVGSNHTFSMWLTDATRLSAADYTGTFSWGATSYRYVMLGVVQGAVGAATGGTGVIKNVKVVGT